MVEVEGRFVTFTPPQDATYLVGDFTDWKQAPLSFDSPITIEFPQGAYIEYAYLDTKRISTRSQISIWE